MKGAGEKVSVELTNEEIWGVIGDHSEALMEIFEKLSRQGMRVCSKYQVCKEEIERRCEAIERLRKIAKEKTKYGY